MARRRQGSFRIREDVLAVKEIVVGDGSVRQGMVVHNLKAEELDAHNRVRLVARLKRHTDAPEAAGLSCQSALAGCCESRPASEVFARDHLEVA